MEGFVVFDYASRFGEAMPVRTGLKVVMRLQMLHVTQAPRALWH